PLATMHFTLFLPPRPRTPRPTLFPYTTLFRSSAHINPQFLERHSHFAENGNHIHSRASRQREQQVLHRCWTCARPSVALSSVQQDRKSTRLNSSHDQISYAVFCSNKKRWRTYA